MAVFTPERRTIDAPHRVPHGRDRREAGRPAAHEAYWRDHYTKEPYYERGYTFEDYRAAYKTGWEGRSRYLGKEFEDIEGDLEFDYEQNRGKSRLDWDRIRHAVRAAWERLKPE